MNLDRAAWLQQRRKGIGASEVAAILGLSKWKTALEVYKEKIGDLPLDREASDRQRLGMILQRPIIDEYCESNACELVAYEPEIIRHSDYPFLLASLDAVVKNVHGDEANVDAKNVHLRAAQEWGEQASDRMPDDAFYQGHMQNFISGRFKTDFAVCVGGDWPPRVYTVARDDEFVELLLDDLMRFWHHVKTETPPPPDFAHRTTIELMKRIYPGVDVQKEITISASYAELAERYWLLGQIEKAAKDRRDGIKAELLFALGDAAIAKIDGSPIALKRTPIPGGAVVHFVKDGYVRFDAKFPKHHEHELTIADAPQLLSSATHREQMEVVNG